MYKPKTVLGLDILLMGQWIDRFLLSKITLLIVTGNEKKIVNLLNTNDLNCSYTIIWGLNLKHLPDAWQIYASHSDLDDVLLTFNSMSCETSFLESQEAKQQ